MSSLSTEPATRPLLPIQLDGGASFSLVERTPAPTRKPVDLATYYKAAEQAGARAAEEIFSATISTSAPLLWVAGAGTALTGAVLAAMAASLGDATPLAWGQAMIATGAATAVCGWFRRRRTIPEEGVRANRQKLLAIDTELQPAAAAAAESILTFMLSKRTEKRLSQPAQDRLVGAFTEMRCNSEKLTSDERAASAIAAAVTQVTNLGFSSAKELTTISEQLALLQPTDAARIASEVALRLFDGPESRYAPRFEVGANAPRHVLDDFRTTLLALVPPPCPIQRLGLTGRSQAWLRAGEEVTIPGVGPAVARGLDGYPRFETMDGKRHTYYDHTTIIRDGQRYRTIAHP